MPTVPLTLQKKACGNTNLISFLRGTASSNLGVLGPMVMVEGVLGVHFDGVVRPTSIFVIILLPVIHNLFQLFFLPFATQIAIDRQIDR